MIRTYKRTDIPYLTYPAGCSIGRWEVMGFCDLPRLRSLIWLALTLHGYSLSVSLCLFLCALLQVVSPQPNWLKQLLKLIVWLRYLIPSTQMNKLYLRRNVQVVDLSCDHSGHRLLRGRLAMKISVGLLNPAQNRYNLSAVELVLQMLWSLELAA